MNITLRSPTNLDIKNFIITSDQSPFLRVSIEYHPLHLFNHSCIDMYVENLEFN